MKHCMEKYHVLNVPMKLYCIVYYRESEKKYIFTSIAHHIENSLQRMSEQTLLMYET